MIETAVESVVGLALMVLPGLGVRTIARSRHGSAVEEFVYGVALTPIVVAAVAVVLLGTSTFSPTRAAVLLGAIGLVGAVRGARIADRVLRRPMAWLVTALVVPFAWTTTVSGAPPASTFQWYYWNLGTQISRAGGVPSSVREYGRAVRWLPDYVVFNVLSEAYDSLSPVGTPTGHLVALRIPLALLGAVTCFLMFRLWLSRPAALVATVVLVPSTWFVLKFDAYKPEAYGAVLGIAVVILVVCGLRQARLPVVLLGGALLGVDFAVHAIAATAFTGLAGVAAVVELIAIRGGVGRVEVVRRDRARRSWVSLIGAGALGGLLLVAIGWTLQGRALVFADAGHPVRGADGTDPTLVYTRYSSGLFHPNPTIDLEHEIAQGVSEPWADLTLAPWAWISLSAVVAGGVVLSVRSRPNRPTRLVATLVGFAVLLAAGAVWSATAYDTYVPRHTGLSRLAQYSPLVLAGLVGLAAEGYLRALGAARRHAGTHRVIVVGYSLGAVAVLGTTVVTMHQMRDDARIRPSGEAALAFLSRHVGAHEVTVANVGTRGLVTFRTGTPSLLEGRQPFLESARFLAASNRVLAEAHTFFTGRAGSATSTASVASSSTFATRYRVDWILIAATPADVGAVDSYGVPVPGWRPPGFALAFERPGIRVFRRTGAGVASPAAVGAPKPLSGRTTTMLTGLGIVALAVLGSVRRRSRTVPLVAPPRAEPLVTR